VVQEGVRLVVRGQFGAQASNPLLCVVSNMVHAWKGGRLLTLLFVEVVLLGDGGRALRVGDGRRCLRVN
jgi:hypothetical protein